MLLSRAVDYAQELVAQVLAPGDLAIDATIGNGHDTLFLARCVGEEGRVYGFDVQEAALNATRKRLEEAGVGDRVTLFERGHETMRAALPPSAMGQVKAVMFNLGYLPGSPQQSETTHPEQTVPALKASADLLAAGGLITVVCYTGHPGGTEETQTVYEWVSGLDPQEYHTLSYRPINRHNAPPQLLAIERQ